MTQANPVPAVKNHFIRVYEIWTPDANNNYLSVSSAWYGQLDSFEEYSANFRFACGEGLPGKAWKEERPVVLQDFEESVFLRTEAAHKAGLTAAVAIPIFSRETLMAVIVMLCGDKDSAVGAIEVWQDDHLSGMGLVNGYYGEQGRFEWLSKMIRFPKGVGVPGSVWKSGNPMVVGDLGKSDSFLRAENAIAAGITTGIGIPFYSPANVHDISAVLTFLSANKTPIAERFEVWEETDAGHYLYFFTGIDEAHNEVETANKQLRIARGEGPIGKALETGVPIIEELADHADYEFMMAVPVERTRRRGRFVVVFYH